MVRPRYCRATAPVCGAQPHDHRWFHGQRSRRHPQRHHLPGSGGRGRGRRHWPAGLGTRHPARRPKADVYEYLIRAGHFGLVVGSTAVAQTWPTVSQWVQWREGEAAKPPSVDLMYEHEAGQLDRGGVPLASRVAHGLSTTTEVAITAARTAKAAAATANKSVKSIAVEAVRTLPRLTRLGQIHDHTRISMGRLMTEQARRTPHGECFLFDGRVHTYEAVDRRINNVVKGLIEVGVRQGVRVGILMETRPSALVAIAALSRLGAVAVLLPRTPTSRWQSSWGDLRTAHGPAEPSCRAGSSGTRAGARRW